MGSTIYADNKMQYYPTDSIITMQSLSIVSDYYTSTSEELRSQYMNEYIKQNIDKKFGSLSDYTIEKCCNNKEFHNNIKFFIKEKVIADLFAGEGEWLKLFKTNCDSSNILIGNELETNKYNTMIENNLIDYHYNKAMEDLQLPKKCVDIMLFNPPYGESMGIRNARRYLDLIFNRNIMSKHSCIIMVLNENDLKDCTDLIVKNIKNYILYKSHKDEFDKFGQFILIGQLLDIPLNITTLRDSRKYKEEYNKLIELIQYTKDNNIEYNIDLKFAYAYKIGNTAVKINEIFNNFKYIKENKDKVSKYDTAWKWIKHDTEMISLADKIIEVPKKLKEGEIANIISSGKINGEISLKNGEGKHIVVGGVKQVETQNKIIIANKKGEKEEKIEIMKRTVPFVNVLINNHGNIEIKELKQRSDN